jgi:transposase
MSLPPPPVQRSLFDVQNLLGREFDPTDRFRLFQEKVYPLLLKAREQLAACYCADNGQRAEEPVTLLGATLLQYMERSPDRQAAECVAYHLGWKLALGLELAVGSFHATTFCTFRERLLNHEKAKVAFDAVLSGLVEAGLVSRRSKQRLDSTHVLGLDFGELSRAVAVAFKRAHVEHLFRVLKSEVGFGHYEGRSYKGMMRHLVLCQVLLLFLALQTAGLRGEKRREGGKPAGHDGADRLRPQRPVPPVARPAPPARADRADLLRPLLPAAA